MKNKLVQRALCFVLSVTLLLTMFGFSASAASPKDPVDGEKYPYSASTLTEMEALVGTLSYNDYKNDGDPTLDEFLKANKGASLKSVFVNIKKFTGDGVLVSDSELCTDSYTENREAWTDFDYDKNAGETVYLAAQSAVTWTVDIEEADEGYYFMKVEYFTANTAESSISSIERKIKIDGKVPFKEVSNVKFTKSWVYDNIEVVESVKTNEPDSYDVKYDDKTDGVYTKTVTSVSGGVKTVTVYTISQDINGNSMAPGMNAIPTWNTSFVQDSSGYVTDYLAFRLGEGSRTITFESIREPMVIKSIELVPVSKSTSLASYKDYVAKHEGKDQVATNGNVVEIQAEFPDMVSDSSVAPTNDNTSPLNYPIDSGSQKYNIIGENSYSSVGQWAAYKFRVSDSGFYNIGMRYKQSALQGMFVCRTIRLSGGEYGESPIVPFAEAAEAEFNYDKNWQSNNIGRDDEDFLFYFEEGVEYTLYLECSLGTLRSYIERVEASLEKVNSYYLSILQLTGTDPDEHTDYDFFNTLPDVVVGLLQEAVELMEVKNGLQDLCGTNGSHIATLETVALLLNTMGKDQGDKIPENMSTLKSYLGTLGTWINSSKSSSISVDSVQIIPAKSEGGKVVANTEELKEAGANFFHSLWFEVQSFFASFFVDYDQMGLTTIPDEDTPTIDVWLATGRDQSQIWRTMIDAHDGFTDSTGTAVALKLVTAGTLLPSILSGKGPDVYIGLGSSDVINYAIRNAVVGISGNAPTKDRWTDADNEVFSSYYYTYKNDDGSYEVTDTYKGEDGLSFTSKPFDVVVDGDSYDGTPNFAPAAMDTVTLLDVSYGVPQTMSFAMMFYRMDVLAELGQEVPQSWDELLSVLPVLQSNNMSIGVSYISALDFMIYQKGGSMWKYTDSTLYDSKYAGMKVDLDSDIALEAFQYTCRLYTDYSFPVSYDAANRFRTGEMPIIIGDYASIYNQLVVYATEIEGLWEFCSLPGSTRIIRDSEGRVVSEEFNYDSLAGVSATVILYGCDNLLASWQFTQWQTDTDAQSDYGNRMVALIGPSAKYETANLNAIENLSWTANEKKAIKNQMEHLSSIVNYPGSYIITRYMQFAFLDVVNESADPVDAMTGYIDAINTEIERKRQEFGLETAADKGEDWEPPMLSDATKTSK